MRAKSKRNGQKISLIIVILVVFVLSILPMLLLQIYNYNWNGTQVEMELTSAAARNTQYLAQSFQEQRDSLIYQQHWLLNNLDMTRYLIYQPTMSDAERYVLQERILDYMKNIGYTSGLILRLEVYYPSLRTVFETTSISARSQEMTIKIRSLDSGELAKLQAISGGQLLSLRHEEDTLVLDAYRQAGQSAPVIICRIVLNASYIEDLLQGYDESSAQKAFLLSWENGVLFAGVGGMEGMYPRLNSAELYRGGMEDSFEITDGSQHYIAFYSSIPDYHLSFVQLVDRGLLKAIPDRLRALLIGMTALVILSVGVYMLVVHRLLNKPIQQMLVSFKRAGQGDLNARIEPCVTNELDTIASGFNSMAEQLEGLIETNYQQKLLLQDAKLRQLQSQIKPHFLYNSFFMLRHAVQDEEIDKAEQICAYLANYFRFLTRLDHEKLLLQEEYENTAGYIAIQEMRFSTCLTIQRDELPDTVAALRVPALILQPLIENAIDYGMTQEKNLIRIRFEESETLLLIQIEDSNVFLGDKEIASMNARLAEGGAGNHAIGNIHSRLRLFYGEAGALHFERSGLGGCAAVLTIPKSRGEQVQEG